MRLSEAKIRQTKILQAARVVNRPLPLNFDFLSIFWQRIFKQICVQEEPEICLWEGGGVEVNTNSVLHESPSRYFLSHHEWSEAKRLYKIVNRPPEIKELKEHPIWAFKKIFKYSIQMYFTKNPEPLSLSRPVVLFWDNRCTENFFHWMVDALSRLNLFMGVGSVDKPFLAIPEGAINRQYVLPTLECFGFRFDDILWLRSGSQYLAHKIAVVSPAIYSTGACSSSSISMVRDRLGVQANKPSEMIYLARKPIFGRKISNELEFEALVSSFGFKKVYPEDYPFEVLKELLGRAKVVLGIHGAALANCLFMPAGGYIIEIANEDIIGETPTYWDDKYPAKYSGDYYYSLASACNLNYCFIPCSKIDRSQSTMVADVLVDLELLASTLKII